MWRARTAALARRGPWAKNRDWRAWRAAPPLLEGSLHLCTVWQDANPLNLERYSTVLEYITVQSMRVYVANRTTASGASGRWLAHAARDQGNVNLTLGNMDTVSTRYCTKCLDTWVGRVAGRKGRGDAGLPLVPTLGSQWLVARTCPGSVDDVAGHMAGAAGRGTIDGGSAGQSAMCWSRGPEPRLLSSAAQRVHRTLRCYAHVPQCHTAWPAPCGPT